MSAAALQDFLCQHEQLIAPLERERNLAWWEHATTGTKEAEQRSAELSGRYRKLHADPAVFERLSRWRSAAVAQQPLLARQLEVVYLNYLGNQSDPESIDRIVRLEAEAESIYANYRGRVDGQELSDNDIHRILLESDDAALRRQAWEASKGIGPLVQSRVLELVELRNQAARRLGYRDHFVFSLALQELDEDELLALLDQLELLTREPFFEAKAELDRRLAERFQIAVEALHPWHYADPFFQEPPPNPGLELEAWYRAADILELARKTFDGLWLPVEPILARSDLYPRSGKNQHAFAIDIDRGGDVRILCNLEPSERWTSTALHELGHAVYDAGIDPELPFTLRSYAHTLSTEAIALLMGRLTRDPEWIEGVAAISAAQVGKQADAILEQQRLGMLIFVRWALVMVRFERALYSQREPDLGAVWWSLVERLQGIARPPGAREADWAAKLHLALAPVYYHNYILGELCASQLVGAIRLYTGRGLVANSAGGSWLAEHIFRPGARYRWDELIRRATGRALGADAFVAQYLV
ncbi:MAG TPA: M2 family metallopeptidase [Acidobacteriota bacterium]